MPGPQPDQTPPHPHKKMSRGDPFTDWWGRPLSQIPRVGADPPPHLPQSPCLWRGCRKQWAGQIGEKAARGSGGKARGKGEIVKDTQCGGTGSKKKNPPQSSHVKLKKTQPPRAGRGQKEEWLEKILQTANNGSGPCLVPRSWAQPRGQGQGPPPPFKWSPAGEQRSKGGAGQTHRSLSRGLAGSPPQKCAPTLHTHARTHSACPRPPPRPACRVPRGLKGTSDSPVGLKNKRNLILQYFIS